MKETIRQKIEEFKDARMDMLATLQDFPKDKVTDLLFSDWSVKDILAHITAWDLHSIDVFDAIQNNEPPDLIENDETFNKDAVGESVELDYDEVLENFIEAGALLIDTYLTFPDELWEKPVSSTTTETPLDFLMGNTNHYRQEHLPVITSYLEKHFK